MAETIKTLEDFMKRMRRQFRYAEEAEHDSRIEQLDDRRFRASQQWDPAIQAQREKENRPCMTINRIPQFLSQVTNQARASKPSITVVPRGGGSRVDTANYLQGLIRDIELKSDADVAYMTAGDSQAEIGLGYIKLVTAFEEDDTNSDTFNQEVRIKRVPNRFSIYMDPSCQEFDKSDSRFCFEIEDLTPEDYEERYGDKVSKASIESFCSTGDEKPYWMPGGSIRIAHYWYAEEIPVEIVSVRFADGRTTVVKKSSLDLKLLASEGAEIVATRTKIKRQIRNCVVNAVGILENADPSGIQGAIHIGKHIPYVPVIGNEILLDGKIDYRGMVRDAKEPQRAYNYWVTATVETVALAPKAPWIIAEGQDEGYEDQWINANVQNYSVLKYVPVTLGGQLAPPPQRNAVEPPILAMSGLIRQADNDLKATMGFYDASLGQTGPEQSGKAILARQKQGEIGNSQYLDNLSRAIRRVGMIALDWIPHLYDTERMVRIIGDDAKPSFIQHKPGAKPTTENLPEGIKAIVDLTAGRYDVAITVGPSFLSRRQEAVAQIGELMGQSPSIAQVVADIWIGNMDAPWAAEAAARLKRMVPPQILGEEGAGEMSPQAIAQIQQMGQQLQMLGQQYQALQQELQQANAKLASKDTEANARIEAERIRAETAERIARIEVDARAALERIEGQFRLQVEAMKLQQKEANDRRQAEVAVTSAAERTRATRPKSKGKAAA